MSRGWGIGLIKVAFWVWLKAGRVGGVILGHRAFGIALGLRESFSQASLN